MLTPWCCCGRVGSLWQDVYERVCAVMSDPATLHGVDPEHTRFMQHALRDSRRLGLHLDAAKRAKVEEIQTRISKLCIDFQHTLGEVDTKLYFTPEELAGVSSSSS